MNGSYAVQRRPLKLAAAAQNFVLAWSRPLSAALFTFLLYTMLAALKGWAFRTSPVPYHNYLADAFLHGQLYLRLMPPDVQDLILYNGKFYLYWPPFPALTLLPWVAILGVNFSDVLYNVILSALIAALAAGLLKDADRRGLVPLTALQRSMLVIFFVAGTMLVPMVPFGRVWFTGQLVGLVCVIFAYWAVLHFRGWRAFLFAGLGMAGALASRNTLILVGLWPAWYLLHEHGSLVREPKGWLRLTQLVLLALTPLLITLGLMGWYNAARFSNPLEVGLQYHLMAPYFRPMYEQYGAFNLHYLPTNFYNQFLNYSLPLNRISGRSGSLFMLSPLFFAALWSLWQDRRQFSTWLLLVTLVIGYLPIGLLMGTGLHQFGPRYLLDLVIPLLLLTAQGMRRWPIWLVSGLVTISGVQYLIGVAGYMP